MSLRLRVLPVALALTLLPACARTPSLLHPTDPRFTRMAPDSFDVRMTTTKGDMTLRIRRFWSPHGVDRFYVLVRSRFFDDVAFHRTIRNFVAQFGISGDTAVTSAWHGQNIPDDTVRAPNRRGTLAYARGGPGTRSTQLYFNLVDNTPRLDTLNGFGFPPIGEVVQGIDVLDSLDWEYSGTRGVRPAPAGPSQDSIRLQGNAYLHRVFPNLDYIVQARVVKSWD